jgi:hypothetical protein
MSTITSTESLEEVLFNSFTITDRTHDLRTAHGKAWRALATTSGIHVTVGVADLLVERGVYNDDDSQVTYVNVPTPYNALHVSVRVAPSIIKETAEAYLREVAPNRTVRDGDYNQHTIPNTVRVNLEWVILENAVEGWSSASGTYAHKVVSYTIDPVTDEVVETFETVSRNHEWVVNPFTNVESWRRGDDTTENLKSVDDLLDAILKKRDAIAEGERREQIVKEVIEAGIASASYKFTTSRQSVEKFIAKFNEPKEHSTKSHDSYRIRDAFDLASDTAVAVLGEHFLRVLGKTTWEVNSNLISGHRYSHSPVEPRPVFIDEVYAYAIVVENFCDRNADAHASIKGEVLGKFTRLIHNW